MNGITLIQDKNSITTHLNEREGFLSDYRNFLGKYIADGTARNDTMITYYSHIEQFLNWCAENSYQVLNIDKRVMVEYRNYLVEQGLQSNTISLKLSCIRRFFEVAAARKIIDENPVLGVRAPRNRKAEAVDGAKYITAGKLEFLFASIPHKGTTEVETLEFWRAKAIIALMGLQGLRTVEVHRLSSDDVDLEKGLLLIRGKGRDRYIAPRQDVLDILKKYLQHRYLDTEKSQDVWGTPVFTSVSNNHKGCRMSRCGIRDVVDFWFIKSGIREKGDKSGKSCHLLRHTTGALLYQATHDLLVVQRELGHADPKTTSKYAHIQNIMSERYTQAIPVKPV